MQIQRCRGSDANRAAAALYLLCSRMMVGIRGSGCEAMLWRDMFSIAAHHRVGKLLCSVSVRPKSATASWQFSTHVFKQDSES